MIAPQPTRKLYGNAEIQVFSWSNVKAGDELGSLNPGAQVFSVQVVGTFGGASVKLEGSLDDETFGTMPLGLGEPSVIGNSNIVCYESPVLAIRPRLVGGDDTTKLNILLSAVQK